MKQPSDDPKGLLNKPLAEMTKEEIVEAITISDHRRWKQFVDSWGVWITTLIVTLLAVKLLQAYAPGWGGVVPALGLSWGQVGVIALGVAGAGALYIRKASQS